MSFIKPNMNQIKIKERLNSFLDLPPDEVWLHQYNVDEINSYIEIVIYLFSGTNIEPIIFPLADGGISIQYVKGKLSTGMEINLDLEYIIYMCYDKTSETFIESFEIPLTLDSQTVVKNLIRKNNETN